MKINTNVSSLTAQEANVQVNKNLSSSLEKLSTGLRINKASDDASGMAIADKLRTQASSLGQSIANANSASALIQIADKAMSEQSNILDTVKTKLIQAANSTTSTDGKKAILKDIQKLLEQLDSIASQTNYNGITLLQAGINDTSAASSLSFQVGELASNVITSNANASANTSHLGGGSTTLVDTTTGVELVAEQIKEVRATGATDAINLLATTGNASATGSIDITIDGKIDKISGASSATNGTEIITLTVTNVDDIAFLDALAALDNTATDGFTGTGTVGVYTLSGADTLNLSDHNFAELRIQTSDTSTGVSNAEVFSQHSLNIKNNSTNASVYVAAETSGLVGGDLLSTLKGLHEDSLTASVATSYLSVVDNAITELNTTRSDFGSTQNQLESAVRNMATTQTNIKAAESVIRDVDYAQESANFNKQNIISQAGTYALSQANNVQQNILRLLQ